MAVFLSPIFGAGAQLFDDQGRVLAGGSISTYVASTSTPQTTYTDSTGLTPNGPVITLDAAGRTPQEIWVPGGVSLKFIVKNSGGAQQGQTWDNVQGLNDPGVFQSQWVSTGLIPTYISSTQFTVPGNQTSTFQVGRRVRYTLGTGILYGIITVSAFTTVTTVTIRADVSGLDNTLSVVDVGLLTPTSPSEPFTPSYGTYTPVSVVGANIASATVLGLARWGRSGNMVTVSGGVSVTPTAGAGTASAFTLTIPIASIMPSTTDLAGTASAINSADVAQISAGTNVAAFQFTAATNAVRIYNYFYQYAILP